MDDRTCQACGKEFRSAWYLRRHAEKRKTPCVVAPREGADVRLVCKYCGRGFTALTNRARHERTSCRKREKIETGGEPSKAANEEELGALKAQLAAQGAQLEEQGAQLAQLAALVTARTVPAIQGQAEAQQAGVVQNVETQVNNISQVDARVQNVDARTYVTVVLGELEKADLGALAQMMGRIGEEKREGAEAAWRWMLEGARAVHGGAAGGLLVPNKKEDKVLRVRGGRWSEEQTAAAVKEPTERLLWELVSSVNRGLMKVHWTELPEKEGPYLGLDRGLKGLMDEKREELVGRGGPLYAVGVENAADWRREGKKMPKPGEAAELKVEE